jgi:23S rRNA (uridine2552-2'-O)-methyltransferase
MYRSKSSQRWLQEHFNDVYVKKAQTEGYRSRAVYKLKEIDDKDHLFQSGMTVLDLGAAPGGWSQYAAKKLSGNGRIIALDLLPIAPLSGVEILQGDFSDDLMLKQLYTTIAPHTVDVLLSDMAPNMSGNAEVDIPRAMYLAELALDCAYTMLKPGGNFLMKIFHGAGFDEIIKAVRTRFKRVVIRKPLASRPRSRETYLLAKDFLG